MLNIEGIIVESLINLHLYSHYYSNIRIAFFVYSYYLILVFFSI